MGLFTRLVNQLVGEGVEQIANEVKKGIVNGLGTEEYGRSVETTETAKTVETKAVAADNPFRSDETREELIARMESVIKQAFAEYTVECNVPASVFGDAHPKAKPVTFLMSRDGLPKLAIVIHKDNHGNSMPILGTRRLVEAKGIGYTRFFENYPNKDSYIVDRINQNL